MKYFTKDLIKAENDPRLTKAEQLALNRRFSSNCRVYQRQLGKLKGRISKQAWNFFYLGFGRWGLHDAQLLSFSVGDGLNYQADGRSPFKINKAKCRVKIEILNWNQDLLYTFVCTDVRKAVFDYPTDDPLDDNREQVDMLYTYELTKTHEGVLSLEFLFVSGAMILIEFARLKFSRKRLRRRYRPEEMYS